jgi:hypothetical protein
VPAYISGTRYHQSVAWSFFRRHHARVRFGKPIDLSRYWIPRADKEALSRISNRFLERIRELADTVAADGSSEPRREDLPA